MVGHMALPGTLTPRRVRRTPAGPPATLPQAQRMYTATVTYGVLQVRAGGGGGGG